jgi:peptidoglycan/LPS O-acetylase OafA/YrhL
LADERTKLDSLTSLRFLAAAMIVVYHTLGIIWWPSDAVAPFLLNQGVSFFFVLSGFVLHLSYRGAIANYEFGFGSFMIRRWFRLWPAHAAALLLVVALAPSISFADIASAFSAFEVFQIVFMFHALNPDIGVYYAINPPAWSISTEFLFYLFLPLLSGLAVRNRGVVLGGGFAFLAVYLVVIGSLDLDENQLTSVLYISPLARIFEFVLGVVACESWTQAGRGTRLHARATLAEALSLGIVALAMYSTQAVAGFAAELSGRTLERYVEVAFAAPPFALLITVFASQQGRISQALTARPFVRLGEISFALYLVHLTLLHYVGNLSWVKPLPVAAQVGVYIVVALVASWLCFRTVETYGIQLGRRIAARIRQARAR